tara:strand:- start:45 stop:497 length:453 start_codon:yes stop_codon:yes gene_type:complete
MIASSIDGLEPKEFGKELVGNTSIGKIFSGYLNGFDGKLHEVNKKSNFNDLENPINALSEIFINKTLSLATVYLEEQAFFSSNFIENKKQLERKGATSVESLSHRATFFGGASAGLVLASADGAHADITFERGIKMPSLSEVFKSFNSSK